MKTDEQIWIQATKAALQGLVTGRADLTTKSAMEIAELAACMGDVICHNFDQRFGDLAQIMKGIPRCAQCQKETDGNAIMYEGVRFCNDKCMKEFRDS